MAPLRSGHRRNVAPVLRPLVFRTMERNHTEFKLGSGCQAVRGDIGGAVVEAMTGLICDL